MPEAKVSVRDIIHRSVMGLATLALLLQRTNRYAEAADYWRHYLASDRQSEFAAARRARMNSRRALQN